jgi:hypothetical protein
MVDQVLINEVYRVLYTCKNNQIRKEVEEDLLNYKQLTKKSLTAIKTKLLKHQ